VIAYYNNISIFLVSPADILDNGSLTIQYSRNRYYHYYTGRFTTHDRAGYIDGMNPYEYVTNNPANGFDTFALKCQYLHKKDCTMLLKSAYTWDATDSFRWASRIELAYNVISLLKSNVPGVPIGTIVTAKRIHYVRATPVWTEYFRFTHYEGENGIWKIYGQVTKIYRRVSRLAIRAENFFEFSTTMKVDSPFYERVVHRITDVAESQIPAKGLGDLCTHDNKRNTETGW